MLWRRYCVAEVEHKSRYTTLGRRGGVRVRYERACAPASLNERSSAFPSLVGEEGMRAAYVCFPCRWKEENAFVSFSLAEGSVFFRNISET